jgi:hypothetical protein
MLDLGPTHYFASFLSSSICQLLVQRSEAGIQAQSRNIE